MNESPQYEAFRAFARSEIRAGKLELKAELAKEIRAEYADEIRALRAELERRSAPQVIEGPAGKDGVDGKNGVDGKDGKDGAPGERGAPGVGSREEIESIVEQRVSEIQVRTFADVYQGVYENGRTYTRGLLTTWGGSLWLSKSETRSRPGESPDWTMVVKRGDAARK